MTPEELRNACEEVEKDCKELGIEPAINLMVPGNRYGASCRIAPGLTGRNLGHYGDQTMVRVKTAKIRKFLKKIEEADKGSANLK